jgi:hypothetical protein
MLGMSDEGLITREIGNLRFLIEQQLRLIDDLDRRGLNGLAAQDLLRRLMRRDEELRSCLEEARPRRVA